MARLGALGVGLARRHAVQEAADERVARAGFSANLQSQDVAARAASRVEAAESSAADADAREREHGAARAKTTALFTGATAAGAISANADPQPWMQVGEALGAAYQTADDLRDIAAEEAETGKPCGQDIANGRPNAALADGVSGTLMKLQDLVQSAVDAVPDCPGSDGLKKLILGEAKRLVPKNLAHVVAA